MRAISATLARPLGTTWNRLLARILHLRVAVLGEDGLPGHDEGHGQHEENNTAEVTVLVTGVGDLVLDLGHLGMTAADRFAKRVAFTLSVVE